MKAKGIVNITAVFVICIVMAAITWFGLEALDIMHWSIALGSALFWVFGVPIGVAVFINGESVKQVWETFKDTFRFKNYFGKK